MRAPVPRSRPLSKPGAYLVEHGARTPGAATAPTVAVLLWNAGRSRLSCHRCVVRGGVVEPPALLNAIGSAAVRSALFDGVLELIELSDFGVHGLLHHGGHEAFEPFTSALSSKRTLVPRRPR